MQLTEFSGSLAKSTCKNKAQTISVHGAPSTDTAEELHKHGQYSIKDIQHLITKEHLTVGTCAVTRLPMGGYLFNLICKGYPQHPQTYCGILAALRDLRYHIKKLNVKEVALPTLGCEADHLEWPRVKELMCDVFRDVPVNFMIHV